MGSNNETAHIFSTIFLAFLIVIVDTFCKMLTNFFFLRNSYDIIPYMEVFVY